jgi:hypothetical protein
MQKKDALFQEWFAKHVFVDIESPLFYAAVLGVIVLAVVLFFVLNALPPQARRRLIMVCTFLGGLYYALEFFIPAEGVWLFRKIPIFKHNPLTGYLNPLSQFLRVLGGFAIGLGLISLFTVHGHRIIRQRKGWGNSFAFFVAFFAIVLFGLWQHFDTGEPPAPTPNLLPPPTYDVEPLMDAAFGLTKRQKAQLEELPAQTVEAPEIAAIQAKQTEAKAALAALQESKEKDEKAIAEAEEKVKEVSKPLEDAQKKLGQGIADVLANAQEQLKTKLEDATLQATIADISAKVGERHAAELKEAKPEKQAEILETMAEEKRSAFQPHLDAVLTDAQKARLNAARAALTRSEKRHEFASTTYDVLFNGMFNSLDSTMFAILAFFIVSAAYRAFRVRSAEATLMMLSAFIIMLGQVPLGIVLTQWIPHDGHFAIFRLEKMARWILTGINAAAFRAIIFGILMGYLAMSLRVWLSLERGSYFRD